MYFSSSSSSSLARVRVSPTCGSELEWHELRLSDPSLSLCLGSRSAPPAAAARFEDNRIGPRRPARAERHPLLTGAEEGGRYNNKVST